MEKVSYVVNLEMAGKLSTHKCGTLIRYWSKNRAVNFVCKSVSLFKQNKIGVGLSP